MLRQSDSYLRRLILVAALMERLQMEIAHTIEHRPINRV